MKEEKKFDPSELYHALDKDVGGRARIDRPMPEVDRTESQVWVREVEKAVAEAQNQVEQRRQKTGNWLEAFSSVLYDIESKIFDPRFEKALGRGQVKRTRDNVSAIHHEVGELMKDEKESKWKKITPEEKRRELLRKLKQVL